MKISASVYSQKDKSLPELVKELDKHQIDLFHIDCNDDMSVFADIEEIRKHSNTPIDLHIISSAPQKFFEEINRLHIENVTFQYENLKERIPFRKYLKTNLGLAIVSETPVQVYGDYAEEFSFLLFMTTTPGKSGGVFNKENFKKIRTFKKLHPGVNVHVDGGVNAEVSFILRNMGVDSAVVGSYLFKQEYIGQALLNLKSEIIQSHFLLSDFMIGLEELPVLKYSKEVKLIDILKSIEQHALGFSLVVNENGLLQGLISNADVRKGLIRNYEKINTITIDDVVNHNPLSFEDNKTISELFALIKKQKFPVLYIPLTDKEKRLTGALTFNNLIKGES